MGEVQFDPEYVAMHAAWKAADQAMGQAKAALEWCHDSEAPLVRDALAMLDGAANTLVLAMDAIVARLASTPTEPRS